MRVNRSELYDTWIVGWHDCVLMRTFDNVSGHVINKASCIAMENGGGGRS